MILGEPGCSGLASAIPHRMCGVRQVFLALQSLQENALPGLRFGETLMHLDEKISAFIEQIYVSAHTDDAWEEMALTFLHLMNCRNVFISTVNAAEKAYHKPATRMFGFSDENTELGAEEYYRELYKGDLTLAYAAAHPNERFCNSKQVYPADGYLDHPYIRWNRRRFGSTHWVVGYSMSEDGLTFGVSLHPPATVGPLPRDKEKLFRLLFDHMDRAVRLAARPPNLDAASDARLFLGRDGRVFGMSPRAEQIMAQEEELRLNDGYIQIEDQGIHAQLHDAVTFAANAKDNGQGGAYLRVPRKRGPDRLIVATPLLPGATPSYAFQPKVLLRIIDQSMKSVLPPGVGELFGFTTREVEVAALLVAGHTPEGAALHLGISRNTLRAHLQSIFRKSRTNRQSELARLLLELA